MSKKKIWPLLIAVILLLVLLPIGYDYYTYRQIRVDNKELAEFNERLMGAVERQEPFHMKDITPFDWDRMVVFGPYIDRESMEEKVGLKWSSSESYIDYLVDRNIWDDMEMMDEDTFKILFVKGNKVVLDSLFYKSVKLDGLIGEVNREQAKINIIQSSGDLLPQIMSTEE